MLQSNRWLRALWRLSVGGIVLLSACKTDTVGNGSKDAGPDIVTVIRLDASPKADVPAPDSAPDSASDRSPGGGDASADVVADAAPARPCKHEFDNPSCWASYDVTRWTDLTQSFNGALFDGKYVNFFNGASDLSLRYDPTKPFGDSKAWSSLYTYGKANYISSGAFDGRYVYLIPASARFNGAGGGTYDDLIARFDPQAASLSDASAWSSINVTDCNGAADLTVPGYLGGAFDGRYMYFAPTNDGNGASGKAMRYDTQATFTDAGAWSWFDMTTVTANAKGFEGIVFDGSYVYFVPSAYMIDLVNGNYTPSGMVMRYDPKGGFADVASWSGFDTATLTPSAAGFSGATFDGRYIYWVPDPDLYKDIIAVRYDTKSDFTNAGSWQAQNLTKSDQGGIGLRDVYFKGATFDGRYVYYAPGDASSVLRYDTQAGFNSASAWTTFPTWTVGAYSDGFRGAAFDGRYVYLVSTGWGPMMQFDAVTPPTLPPGYGASYY
jgi:hypothetical protein